MKRFVVTGATGFVGRKLVGAVRARGDQVIAITRSAPSALRTLGEDVTAYEWNSLDEAIDGSDVVVHLAGVQAVGRRWTKKVKAEIIDSRVGRAQQIVAAIERAPTKPSVLITASGINYYGSHGAEEPVDERSGPGDDFLARVCVQWENASLAAEKLGVRAVALRSGLVFGRGGGPLAEMVLPFKLYAGGPLGSGEQMMSWIHQDDLIAILLMAASDSRMVGAINAVSPNPVSNAELARTIGLVLDKPSGLAVPAAVLKLRFGEAAYPILEGQAVLPKVLSDLGFEWRYPTVRAALQQALGD